MAEVNSQKMRRALIEMINLYDTSIVSRRAIDDSEEFKIFLDKKISDSGLDSLDFAEIEMELEMNLDCLLTESQIAELPKSITWKDYFDKWVSFLKE